MKKFGFRKKDEAADDDSSRNALFGSRKEKNSSPAPASHNPYAQLPIKADPYAQPPQNLRGPSPQPPPYGASNGGGMDQYRRDKTPVPSGGYGGGPQRFGGSPAPAAGPQGYGSNPYGNDVPQQSARGPGGYGGMGRSNSQDTMSTDVGRNELFGNAPSRYQQPQQQASQSTAYGDGGEDAAGQGYGSYSEQRELTAEEQEEEDVQGVKQEIRMLKQQDVSSTRNALRIAQQAEETGRATLERLGQQGERIHNTEKNLDLASNQNRIAEERARELKTLNRSMFAMHVGNPFTAGKRREERDMQIMDTHQRERAERDATRAAAYNSAQRQTQAQRDLRGNPVVPSSNKSNLADRAKYQFEADSDDDAAEEEIDQNLDALHGATTRMKGLAMAMGQEVDVQNKHIDRITGKTDKVDDQIAMNRARLERISKRG